MSTTSRYFSAEVSFDFGVALNAKCSFHFGLQENVNGDPIIFGAVENLVVTGGVDGIKSSVYDFYWTKKVQ